MGRTYKTRCSGPLKDRILSSISKDKNGCWIWGGSINKANGYGYMSMDGVNMSAHRASYSAFVGEIPAEMFVLHKCDVRACCNPDHLFIGTHMDNMNDMRKKRRYPLGDNHYNTKIPDSRIDEIKQRKRNGERADALASEFGVSKYSIWGIVSGKWRCD